MGWLKEVRQGIHARALTMFAALTGFPAPNFRNLSGQVIRRAVGSPWNGSRARGSEVGAVGSP
eukprot:1518331-Pyramimonas_sp.AAC.1